MNFITGLNNNNIKTIGMKLLYYIIFSFFLCSCANHSFDSDIRQIAAKDEIAAKLQRARAFNVLAFKQDTLNNYPDSSYKKPIQYALDIVYKDSNNVEQKRRGMVLFTHDGSSIIKSVIIDSLK